MSEREQGSTHPKDEATDVPEQDDVTEQAGTELGEAELVEKTEVIETVRGHDDTELIAAVDPDDTAVIDDTPATAAMPTTAFAATEPKPVTTPEHAPAPERVSVAD
ncbi:hypothetical protein, partial [Cellulomonas sp. RIT-PI-Y]|uniref:hypothetical protein n=1 Tax=Cellulomonas sp. RIT-PI-Y TaxID=3035297 RepID=UPI0021DA7757